MGFWKAPELWGGRWNLLLKMSRLLGPQPTHPLPSLLQLNTDWRVRAETPTRPRPRDPRLPQQWAGGGGRWHRGMCLSIRKVWALSSGAHFVRRRNLLRLSLSGLGNQPLPRLRHGQRRLCCICLQLPFGPAHSFMQLIVQCLWKAKCMQP